MKKFDISSRNLRSSNSKHINSTPFLSNRQNQIKPNTSQRHLNNRNSPVHFPDIHSPKIHSLPSRLSPAPGFKKKKSSAHSIHSPAIQKTTAGKVKGYGCNSLSGLVREQNEDRLTMIGNIPQPASYKGFHWPRCSYFAIYDGHGGSACSEFLKQHLHEYIFNDENFPHNPREALMRGFAETQTEFMKFAQAVNNFSGSCAVVVLIVADRCYVANLGDSRALLSYRQGSRTLNLTVDHKPQSEKERIQAAGGSIYISHDGAARLYPGKLAVSRSFGDLKSKSPSFGGVPEALSAVPEIWSFLLNETADFIVMGSDGVFDVMKNENVVELVWNGVRKHKLSFKHCGEIVNAILETALERKTQDNLSCIVINFKHSD